MSTQRVLGGMEETSEDTFGGILASDGVKRDSDSWDIDGIDCTEFLDNAFVDLEHEGPPVAAVDRLGKVTLSDGTRALAISCRWGPTEIPLIAETKARVRAGLYNTFSAALDPIECEPIRGTRGVRVLKSTLLGASIVKLPADPMAKITMRSLYRGNGAAFRALPRIPARSIERAMARIERGQSDQRHVPIGLMSEYERTAFYREQAARRTLAVSLIGCANEAEQRDQRRAELEQLRAIGESYLARRH
ncbi:MAG: hypothetical protein ACLQKH_11240 [Steroidobacteraceae bacterium]